MYPCKTVKPFFFFRYHTSAGYPDTSGRRDPRCGGDPGDSHSGTAGSPAAAAAQASAG